MCEIASTVNEIKFTISAIFPAFQDFGVSVFFLSLFLLQLPLQIFMYFNFLILV